MTNTIRNRSVHFLVSSLPLRQAVAGGEEIQHSYLPNSLDLVDQRLGAFGLSDNKCAVTA